MVTMKKEVLLEIFYSMSNIESQYLLNIAWRLADKHPEIKVREINYDSIEGKELSFKNKIYVIPTIIINKKKKIIGVLNEEELLKEINKIKTGKNKVN